MMPPPLATMGPTLPVPPSVPPKTVTGLLPLAPLTSRVPPLTIVDPVRELSPLRINRPSSVFVKANAPLIGPSSVRVTDGCALTVLLLASVIGPEMEQPLAQNGPVASAPAPSVPAPLSV